jgi:hypothetical protein
VVLPSPPVRQKSTDTSERAHFTSSPAFPESFSSATSHRKNHRENRFSPPPPRTPQQTLLLALQLPTHNNITLFSFFFFLHYNIVYNCSLCSYSLRSFLHLSGTTHRTLLWPAFAFLLLFRPFFFWLLAQAVAFRLI